MKNILLTISAAFVLGANAQLSPQITSWILNPTNTTGYGGIVSNVQTVQYSASEVYVSASCIPSYSIGPWVGNPNVPSNQNFVCKFTRTPTQNTLAAVYPPLGNIGLWSNGVSVFNPKDGNYWNNGTSSFTMGATTNGFNRNALIYEGTSFDNCLGHPAPGGTYHNHVNPSCLYNYTNSAVHSPIIGYAFDGYPIYGAYAYTTPTNVASPIKRMVSSYVLAPSTGSVLLGQNNASAAVTPTTPTTRNLGPPINGTYPLGNMLEDFVYVAGSGDLDDHNGRFCYTPEFPAGTYAYFVTLTSSLTPAYPFVIGPTYYGTVQAGNTGPGGSHVVISETTTVYTGTVTSVAEQLPNEIKYQIMPNPTQDYVFIYMDVLSTNNVKADLYDAKGKLVKTINYLQPSIAYTLDMSDLSSGMYYLIFQSDKQKTTQKIIKTK